MTTFRPLVLGPWSQDTALGYLRDRASRNSIALDEPAARAVVARLGELIPHHVALFMHFIRLDARTRGTSTCTEADLDRVYKEHMLSVHGHVDLATYGERLKRVVDPALLRPALELLTEAACAGRLTQEAARSLIPHMA